MTILTGCCVVHSSGIDCETHHSLAHFTQFKSPELTHVSALSDAHLTTCFAMTNLHARSNVY